MSTQITAPNAIIRTDTSIGKTKPKRRRNKKPNNQATPKHNPGELQTATVGTTRGYPSKVETMLSEKFKLDENSESWLHHFIDPCGVGGMKVDSRRIPDGALSFSAEAEFLFQETITMPMNSLQITDTTGRNFSLLVLQQPLMRCGTILICHIQSKEFDDTVMSSFSRAFASIPNRESAYYPNWIPCDLFEIIDSVITPVLYFTVLTPTALRAIGEPNESGISTFLSQFRFTSYGVDLKHNTPTLFDQGTYVMGCFPASVVPYTYDENHVRGFDPFFVTAFITTANSITAIATVNGISTPPMNELTYAGILPSPPITITFALRNPTGSVFYPVGTTIRYENVLGQLSLVDDANILPNLVLGPMVVNSTVDKRLYARVDLLDAATEPITQGSLTFNLLTIPPVTQADIQQMDVFSVHGLLKGDHDLGGAASHSGCYLPNRVWQPIFNVQNSSNFRKCIIVNENTPLQDLTNNADGWKDSFDLNFGWAVMNLQSVPWAAAPFIHLTRSDEQVPGHNSILGAYARRAGYKEPIALDIAFSASSELKHGFTCSSNDVRKMFNALSKTLSEVPSVLANANNLGKSISSLLMRLNV